MALCSLCRTSVAQTEVSVPAGCGTAEQFRARIHERLGSESESLLAQTRLRITVEANDYQLWVQVLDKSRTLHDSDCKDLFRAAVVVTLALWNAPVEATPDQPNALAAEPKPITQQEPRVAPSKDSPSGAIIPTSATATRTDPTHSDWSWKGSWGGQFGVSRGLLPRWAIALGANGAVEHGPLGLAADVRYLPPTDERDALDKGVRVQAYGASLAARFRPIHRVGVELGGFAYRVKGEGLGTRADRTAFVVAAGPQLGLWVTALELRGFDLRLGLEAQFALLRPQFEVIEYAEVFRSSQAFWQGYFATTYSF